jgi:hypothetical protein
VRRAPIAATAFGLFVALLGCGVPATFVSPVPPSDAGADAWFAGPVKEVRQAFRQAMLDAGMSIDIGRSSPMMLVGLRQQVPYVDGDSEGPATGSPPIYVMRVELSRPAAETHVRMIVDVQCPSCDGTSPYVWEYPADLIRNVIEHARDTLREQSPRINYPTRYRPPAR